MRTPWKMLSLLVIVALMAASVPAVADPDPKKPEKKLAEAEQVIKASVSAPDKGIPKELFERAECIGTFPGLKKAAFIVGGEGGRGVFTCRQKDGTMGAPAFFTMGGPSIGWQAGVQEADIVLLIMNQEGVKKLLQDKFTIGAEASAVAGPVGRTAQAATDAQLHAQILSWSRSRGVFLGASLEGIVVKPNDKMTQSFYQKPLTARDILIGGGVPVPASAKSFVQTSTAQARRSS